MLYILLGIFAVVAILIILATKLLDAAGLNKRCEGNENLKYLKAKNFDNLNAHPINFKSDSVSHVTKIVFVKLFDVIELSRLFGENVYDNVTVIHNDPRVVVLTLNVVGHKTSLAYLKLGLANERLDVC